MFGQVPKSIFSCQRHEAGQEWDKKSAQLFMIPRVLGMFILVVTLKFLSFSTISIIMLFTYFQFQYKYTCIRIPACLKSQVTFTNSRLSTKQSVKFWIWLSWPGSQILFVFLTLKEPTHGSNVLSPWLVVWCGTRLKCVFVYPYIIVNR